ncbi:MAG: hypothetical protein V4671_09650 [Armatimonadota bacterium]
MSRLLDTEPRPEHPVEQENYLYPDRTPPLAPDKPLIQRTWFIVLMLVVLLPLGLILFLRWMK